MFPDIVSGTYAGIFAIAGTEKIGLLPLVAVGAAVIQFFAAVGAVQKPREHTHDTGAVWPAAVLSEILNEGKGLPVNDSRVGIVKPCVDKRDAAKKRRDKVKQCAENPKIIANKRRKKLDISKQPPVSKNLRTKDAKSAIYGRSKLAIHLPPK